MTQECGERQRLPNRRQGYAQNLIFRAGEPGEIHLDATFDWEETGGWRNKGRIREVFCLAFKEGTDLQSLLHHGCIMISVALQYGATMGDIAHAMGESDLAKKPRSIFGLIVRAGARLDVEHGFLQREAAQA